MANNVKNNTHINNIYAKKGVNELPINLQKLDFYQAAQIMRSLQAAIKNGTISYNFAPLLVLAFANLFLIGSDTAKASATHANADSSNDILNVHGNSAHVDKQGMAVNEQGLKSDPTLAGDAHGTTSTSLAPIISAQGVTTLNYNNGKAAEATTVPHIDTYTPPSNSAGVNENTYPHIGIINHPVVAVDEYQRGDEDSVISGNVLLQDISLDGGLKAIAFSGRSTGDHGTVVLLANGDFTYTPDANFNGVDSFTYTIREADGSTATATVHLTVKAVNDNPVATNDSNTGVEDNILTGNLLANDTDVDGDHLSVGSFTIAGVTGNFNAGDTATIAGVGTLLIGLNGDYTFTPASNYNGSVPTITYTTTDGHGGSAAATLNLTVTPVNDAPVAVNDSNTGAEDTVITGNVLSNDTDVDGDHLAVSSFSVAGVAGSFNAGDSATIAGVGTLSMAVDGSYTFTPALNYNGAVPEIAYTITDGNNGTSSATLNLTVTPVNDAPVANNNSNTGAEDTVITGNVLNNDTDVDGDSLAVSSFTIAGITGNFNAGDSATIAGVGTLSIAANGSYIFTPALNYNGSVPEVSYTAIDGHGGSATATLNLTVTPVNDAPVAANDSKAGAEDNVITGNVLSNDTDVDDDSLAVSSFTIVGVTGSFNAGDLATIDGVGTVLLAADGSYTFTPALNYNGSVPTITYSMTDSHGGNASATLNLTVTPANDAPVAANDSKTGAEDNVIMGNVLSNDSDVDGDSLTVSSFSISGVSGSFNAGTSAMIANVGTLSISENGDYTFTPALNYNGSVPTITYTTVDGHGGNATATLNLTVTPANDAPVATNDSNTGAEDNVITGNVLSNDTDVDGDSLTVSSFSVAGVSGSFNAGTSATITNVGTLSIAQNGDYTFTPVSNYNGSVPIITYTMTDSHGGNASATLNLTVTPVNDAPVAANDSKTGAEDNVITGNVLSNDTDVDGDSLTVSSFTVAGVSGSFNAGTSATITNVGTVSIAQNGDYTFTPVSNYNGSVPIITYTMTDSHGGNATATLNLTVTPVNDAPVATNDSKIGAEDNVITGNVLSNDTDVDGDSLTVSSFTVAGVSGSFNAGTSATITNVGTLSIAQNGDYTFTPVSNYNGSVPTITYSITDNHGGNTSATLNLTVTPVNDAPVATNDSKTGAEDNVITGNILSNDTDADGDSLTVSSFTVAGVSGSFNAGTSATITNVGTVSIAQNGDYTFTPASNYNGSVPTITYSITDSHGGNASATLNLTVTAVNDAPVATNDSKTGAEDNVITGNVLSNDTDVDGDSLTVSSFTVAGVSGSFNAGTSATITNVGTVSIAQNGDYTFTPVSNYNGSVPTITYSITDSHGGNASATLNLTVTAVNDAPVATNDSKTGAEDNVITGNVLSNDTDVDGDSLTVSSFTVAGVSGSFNAGTSATITNVGTVSIAQNGDYTFTPVSNYNGSVPTITYSITDSHGGNASATLNLTVTPVNDAPVATNDSNTGAEDNVITGNVLSNDTDVDGDTLTVNSFTVAGVSGSFNAGTSATITNVGTVSIAQNGDYTFTPASNYNGSVPTITYTATDGHGGNASATLNLTVTAVNDPPVAHNDVNTGVQGNTITGNVLSNDTDVEGDTLNVTTFIITGIRGSFNAGATATIAGVGTLVVAQNGAYVFTPLSTYSGSVPTVTYTASDGHGVSANGILTLSVTPFTAVGDSFSINQGSILNGNVATNDAISSNGGNVWALKNEASHGVVTINADGTFSYTPSADYSGNDSFTYTVTDNHGDVSTATVTVKVYASPVAVADTFSVSQGAVLSGSVATNDAVLLDGNVWALQSGASHGVVTINANGTFTYTPSSNYAGNDSFTYTLTDSQGHVTTATVLVTVNSPATVKTAGTNGADGTGYDSTTGVGNAGVAGGAGQSLSQPVYYNNFSGNFASNGIVSAYANIVAGAGGTGGDGGDGRDGQRATGGTTGSPGTPAVSAGAGGAGGTGGNGGNISWDESSNTFTFQGAQQGADVRILSLNLIMAGGTGGTGGVSGANGIDPSLFGSVSSVSAAGGNGGNVTLSANNNTFTGGDSTAILSMLLTATGGVGGAGGASKIGANGGTVSGGAGGNGGTAIVTASGNTLQGANGNDLLSMNLVATGGAGGAGANGSRGVNGGPNTGGGQGNPGGNGSAAGSGGSGGEADMTVSGNYYLGGLGDDTITLNLFATGGVGGTAGAGGNGGNGGSGSGIGASGPIDHGTQGDGGDGGNGGNGGNGGDASITIASNHFGDATAVSGSDKDTFNIIATAVGGDATLGGAGGAKGVGVGTEAVTDPATGEVTYPSSSVDGTAGSNGQAGNATISFNNNILSPQSGDDTVNITLTATAGSNGSNATVATINFKDNTFNGGDGNDDLHIILTANGDSSVYNFQNNSIDGGTGVNTLDFSGTGVGVSVDLTGNSTNAITLAGSGISSGNTITNIQNVIGTSANDTLVLGGSSNHTLTGGVGSDTFQYNALDTGDHITDFTTGSGGDVLNLKSLLQTFSGYDNTNAFSGGYVQFDNSSGHTVVKIDADGSAGAGGFVTLVSLDNTILQTTDTANYVM